ncbi:MAG: alpha/beta hydrolase family protein [Peptoniphilaceae bacterium]
MEYLKSDFAELRKINIGEVPAYVITPKNNLKEQKTIVFYHGWGSDAKSQIFRGNIFASYGYQVLIPEARFHGERGQLDYEDEEIAKRYMAQVIMHNIEEFPKIHKYIIEELSADPNNIAVGGHSMGAITSGGIFTFKTDLKTALIFNGTMDWKWLVDKSIEDEDEISYERMRINDFLLQMNPMDHLEDIKDRYLVLFNGEDDDVVDPSSMEKFYKEALKHYQDKSLINFEKFEDTFHQLTTQMLDKAIMFIKEKINF